MHEVELKFQVPARQRDAVDAAVAGPAPVRRVRLQAAYFDTPQRTLAAAGLALRVRREGRRWVQTLKGAAEDGMTRLEHNVPISPTSSQVPLANPTLHAGTPAGDRLLALLQATPESALAVLFRTDILRRSRLLSTPQGTVELAFDEGRIVADDRTVAVCELEIELKNGSPLAVIDTARLWLPRHALWLDSRSKAERGDLLSRGLPMAPPRRLRPVRLRADMSGPEAAQAVVRACAEQVVADASQIASDRYAVEHVHQLRVGLRRLRSGMKLLGLTDAQPALEAAARSLFRQLGAVRDRDVQAGPMALQVQAALDSTSEPPLILRWPSGPAGPSPATLVRDAAAQAMLLDLLAWCVTPVSNGSAENGDADSAKVAGKSPKLRKLLARRLARWHRQITLEAGRYAALGDDARHALRKRVKRQRYAVEFSASLFKRRDVRRYVRLLRDLQDRLGELNDVAMAQQTWKEHGGTDSTAWFVLGWLAARRDALLLQAQPACDRFGKAKPFWKRD